MTLPSGTRLGPYEIVSPLGAGGMGEVYRARDTRLDRTVAIKVLPSHLSSSAELRERFEREAKAISQLSHPHICALYDVNREGETEYLVMEYLEGETLSDRLVKGALAFDQVLRYGLEMADALDRAHRQGIVHRDLKPANVMLTKSGVKLLDFGLAKAVGTGARSSGASLTALPTQNGKQLTAEGTILGTFQYMAPEQLEGKDADGRTDIFAFGALLYEMATGRKAFSGTSQASLISSIMKDEPAPISTIAPMTPATLDRVVKTCLAKDPEDRFQTAHDAKLQLQWIAEGGSLAGLPAPVALRRKNRERLAWSVAAVLALFAAAATTGYVRRTPTRPHSVRFEIATPEEILSIDMPRISPDGKYLAFNAADISGKTRLWVRPLNALSAQPLAGTEGAKRPFWSPDSRFLGFFADGKLKKIEVTGGPPQKICDAPTGADGSWSPEGVILFDGVTNDPIHRVSAAGGVPVVAVKADATRKETQVAWPEFLPDGNHYLYMANGEKSMENIYRIGSLDSKESKPVMPAQSLVTYAPPGYLLFVRDKTLVAQRFDPKARKTSGEPVPLAEQIGTDSVGLARFSVSHEGTLAYRTGESGNRLLWVDRAGKEIETAGDPGEIGNPALSRAGDRLAFNLADPRTGNMSIWIRDLARGVSSRFTFGATGEHIPLWSPDGSRMVYSVIRDPAWDLFEKPAASEGEGKELLKTNEWKIASDWSRDGRYIAFFSQSKETKWDIWILPTFGDKKPIPFLRTGFAEAKAVFSPDGRYLAYQSNESGRWEIYVQSFPGPGRKWQLSTSGGSDPSWRSDGKEIFYRSLDQKLMSVEVTTSDTFQAGVPKPLFLARVQAGNARNKYVASPDGQRFLLVAPLGREAMTPTTVVLNWSAELSR